MARIRTVKPEFWRHPVYAQLPDDIQLLALSLLTMADDEGYFRAEAALIRGDVQPFRENLGKISEGIRELLRAGWIEVSKHPKEGEIGRVVNFSKHQRVHNPTASKLKGYFLGNISGNAREIIPLEQGTGNREHDMALARILLTKDQKITIDFAVQHVMAEAVLAGRKIRDVIHEVIGQELTRDPACDLKMIAEQMADSWKRYKAENVNFELSPESFFGRGTWKVPEKWAKDAKPKRPVVDIKQVVADREKEDAEWLDRRTNRMAELKAGGMNPNDVKSTILREGL